jgi:hypothetical protein
MSVEKLCEFYEHFDAAKINRLGEIYAENIQFRDPIHQLVGLPALTKYFKHVCGDGQSRFEITERVTQAERTFLRWHMHYSHPKLASGKPLLLVGGSLLTVADKKIVNHEDFYDMGQMIYQHLPVLGWAIKQVNKHLQGDDDAS